MRNRTFALITVSLISALASAQSYLGTKPGGGSATLDTAPGQGAGPFIQMVVALAIVLGLLKVVLPKLATRVGKKLVASPNSNLRVEETAHFAGGTLYIVQARSKTLLLGVNGASVTCLADLTEPKLVPDPPTFQEMVEEAVEKPVTAAAYVAESTPGDESLEEALRRLERLVS